MSKRNEAIRPSRRVRLEKAQSSRSLDSTPLTPSRLLSPHKKSTLNHHRRRGGGGDESMFSPEGMKGLVEVSGQLKDLLGALPTREKGNSVAKDSTKGKRPLSRRHQLRKSQSESVLVCVGSQDSMPNLPTRVLSPEGEKDSVKISNKDQHLLWKLPSRSEKQSRPSADPSIFQTPKTNNSRGLRRMDSSKSLDSIPSLPSRTLSPEGEEGVLEIAGPKRGLLVDTFPSPVDNGVEPGDKESRVAHQAPATPSTKASSSSVAATVVVGAPEVDLREEILARIPDHVKTLLTTEHWFQILEPSVKGGARGNPSVCSDITTDEWSTEGPIDQEERLSEEPRTEDNDAASVSSWESAIQQDKKLQTAMGTEVEENSPGSSWEGRPQRRERKSNKALGHWEHASRSKKQDGPSFNPNLLQTPKTTNSRGLRRMDSSKSLDSIPSLPSRTLSPEGQDDVLEIAGPKRDLLVETFPSHLDTKEEATKREDRAPTTRSTKSSSSSMAPVVTVGQSAVNIRKAISARIPDHAKNLHSAEERERQCNAKAMGHWQLPSRSEKQDGPSLNPNLLQTPKTNNSRGLRRMDSSQSLDSIPSLPSRTLSPEGEEEVLEIASPERDVLVETFPSPLENQPKTTNNASAALSTERGESKTNATTENRCDLEKYSPFTSSTTLVASKAHEDCEEDSNEEPDSMVEDKFCEHDWSGSTKENKRKDSLHVSFIETVTIRWHERILVAHPCASSGPSVGIGWGYDESLAPLVWNHVRRGKFLLTRQDREEIANDWGYSARDIARVVRDNLKTKNERRRTINNLNANVMNVEKVELVMERCNRKIRKFLGKKRR